MDATSTEVLLAVGGVVVLALLALAVLAERPRTKGPDPARLRAAAQLLAAHAARTQADAGRAVAIAEQARAQVFAAERVRDAAWATQEAAERAYETALRDALAGREAALAAPEPAPGGLDRERTVSRAALSAYRRGDISVDELREVWRRAGDWSPAQEERERLAERCRIDQAVARREHDRVAAEARWAEQAAQAAEGEARALVVAARESAVEAHEALLTAQRYVGSRRQRRRARKRR